MPCRAIRLSVAGCLGARRGIPVDLHVTMEGPGCTGGWWSNKSKNKNSRGRALGRLGGYKTLLEQPPGQMSGEQQWR